MRSARDGQLRMTFWGVRGSTPTPVKENLGVGGNTTCLHVQRDAGEELIIDAGTGVRGLGDLLLKRHPRAAATVNLFLTHFHWDHLQGFPFFAPLFEDRFTIRIHARCPREETHAALATLMRSPFFTVDFETLPATIELVELTGDPVRIGAVSVSAFELNHPQGAHGYRIEAGGAVIVHASDFEHGDERLDAELRAVSHDADVLIFDAQYTPDEYDMRRGWGHSSWLEAARVARDAEVGRLFLFHHDPAHDDGFLEHVVSQARQRFARTELARERIAVDL